MSAESDAATRALLRELGRDDYLGRVFGSAEGGASVVVTGAQLTATADAIAEAMSAGSRDDPQIRAALSERLRRSESR